MNYLDDALQHASRGLAEKIQYSVNLLRKAERIALAYDNMDGYFLAFSGGKDSQALYHIAKLAGVKFKGHMNLTSVDPPEIIRFVKREYPDVELIKPRKSIFQVAVEKKILPTQRVRWCCTEFKENAGAGKVTLIGIRHAESSRRAKRNEVEISNRKFSGDLDGLAEYRKQVKGKKRKRTVEEVNITNADQEQVTGCIRGKESILISPIIDWTEKDVWEFLNDVMQVTHCSLYDEGWTRIGCIGCPMSNFKQKCKESKRYPHIKRNWIKAIKKIRARGDVKKGVRSITSFKQTIFEGAYYQDNCKWFFRHCSSSDGLTEEQENEIAENIYKWWISGKSYKKWYAENFLQQYFKF